MRYPNYFFYAPLEIGLFLVAFLATSSAQMQSPYSNYAAGARNQTHVTPVQNAMRNDAGANGRQGMDANFFPVQQNETSPPLSDLSHDARAGNNPSNSSYADLPSTFDGTNRAAGTDRAPYGTDRSGIQNTNSGLQTRGTTPRGNDTPYAYDNDARDSQFLSAAENQANDRRQSGYDNGLTSDTTLTNYNSGTAMGGQRTVNSDAALGSAATTGGNGATNDRRSGPSTPMSLLLLLASLSANVYLGWIAWDTYNRYQDLVSDIKVSRSRRDRGPRHHDRDYSDDESESLVA